MINDDATKQSYRDTSPFKTIFSPEVSSKKYIMKPNITQKKRM